jgi:hypothetical protein
LERLSIGSEAAPPPRMASTSSRRLRRFLVLIIVFVSMTSWVAHKQLPIPLAHPAFDSSGISPQHVTRRAVPSPPPITLKVNGNACDGYDGVLHIESGDVGAAAGTVFFIYVVNQLIYADLFNLLPWVHLNDLSKHVYDDHVHTTNHTIKFQMIHGLTIDFTSNGYDRFGFGNYAGKPKKLLEDRPLEKRTFSVTGTGVWNHYFEPVSSFDFSCPDKPLLRMHYYHLTPGMLMYCPWSVKSWPYDGLAKDLTPKTTVQEWYRPMRRRGSEIVQKYVRFRPNIVEAADDMVRDTSCLALHIRYSDKAGTKRKRIPLQSFLPYVQAYQQGGGKTVVLATDSEEVLANISKEWPTDVTQTVVRQSNDILRSDGKTAVFVAGSKSHDRTNREVLIDILAMSKCQFFVHGFSAVSEAVMYLNFDLHEHSIDLEDHPLSRRMSPSEFQTLVNETLRSRSP